MDGETAGAFAGVYVFRLVAGIAVGFMLQR